MSKRLDEYVLEQTMTGETDMELIQRFLCNEGLQLEALAMIPALAKDRCDKVETKFNNVASWAPYIVGIKRLNGRRMKLTLEEAENLEKLSLMYLCGYELDKTHLYEWAKENIPKMKVPFFFFRPTIDWLEKYGIKFAENNAITIKGGEE